MKTNHIIPLFIILLCLVVSCTKNDNPVDDTGTTPPITNFQPWSPLITDYPTPITDDPEPMIESNDITIGWIGRFPKINYVWGSNNPDKEGWPAVGQEVTWRAFVRNWSDNVKKDVPYQWLLDGSVIEEGTIDLMPGQYCQYSIVEYKWNWEFNRHDLMFKIDINNTGENKLTVQTDALSIGLYIEKTLYDYFHEYQKELGIGSNSFEGWAQRQIRFYNEMFKRAIYPENPMGVLDRYRIDHITIVADEALPLVEPPAGYDWFDPVQALANLNDRTVDLQWGFPTSFVNGTVYSNHSSLDLNNQFYYSGFLQHELGHARGLIDVYDFDYKVNPTIPGNELKENGQPVINSKYMPLVRQSGELWYFNETIEKGLMNSQWRWIDRHSAMAMNRMKGFRATEGNYNSPENYGNYLNDIPHINRIRLIDSNGEILSSAEVKIYQSSYKEGFEPEINYKKYYDDTPEIVSSTDQDGIVVLNENPINLDNNIFQLPWSNIVSIMRVEFNGKIGYTFLETAMFNIQYWLGNTEVADFDITMKLVQ